MVSCFKERRRPIYHQLLQSKKEISEGNMVHNKEKGHKRGVNGALKIQHVYKSPKMVSRTFKIGPYKRQKGSKKVSKLVKCPELLQKWS